MSPASRDRIERLSIRVEYAVIVSIVLCTLLPVLAQLVAGLAHGIVTGRWLAHQGLTSEEGFALWDTQLWLAWVPVACLAGWIGLTIPVPLRRPGVGGRVLQLILTVVILIATVPRVVGGLAGPEIPEWGTRAIFLVIVALGGVVVLRIVLGWLRLLPRSWRVYLDERGAVIRPAPLGRARRRLPLSRVPQ